MVNRLLSTSLTAQRAAAIISLFTLTLTLAGATLVLLLDQGNFSNIGISAWWALQTVTTVGYGDIVPTNTEGRLIGSLVMLGGISFSAVVTASIAAALVEAARQRASADPDQHPLASRLDEVITRLERLERAAEETARHQRPDDDLP